MFNAIRAVSLRSKVDPVYKQLFRLSERTALLGADLKKTKAGNFLISELKKTKKNFHAEYSGKTFSYCNAEGIQQKPLLIGEQLGSGGMNTAYQLYTNTIPPQPVNQILKIPNNSDAFQSRLVSVASIYNSRAIEKAGLGNSILRVTGLGKVAGKIGVVQEKIPAGYFTLTTPRGRSVFR